MDWSKKIPLRASLSFLLPGLGQVYQKQYLKGMGFFALFILAAWFSQARILLPILALGTAYEALRCKAAVESEQPARRRLFSVVGIVGFVCWMLLFSPSVLRG